MSFLLDHDADPNAVAPEVHRFPRCTSLSSPLQQTGMTPLHFAMLQVALHCRAPLTCCAGELGGGDPAAGCWRPD